MNGFELQKDEANFTAGHAENHKRTRIESTSDHEHPKIPCFQMPNFLLRSIRQCQTVCTSAPVARACPNSVSNTPLKSLCIALAFAPAGNSKSAHSARRRPIWEHCHCPVRHGEHEFESGDAMDVNTFQAFQFWETEASLRGSKPASPETKLAQVMDDAANCKRQQICHGLQLSYSEPPGLVGGICERSLE